jgi:anti-sigma factor RsiW
MKCNKVRTKLAGYLDDAIVGVAQADERAQVREHLEGCGFCREELQRYRKLSALLSQVPRNLPPADLAVRIRVAAAQSIPTQDLPSRMRRMRDRLEILLDNVFRPMTVPATGGFFSAILVFVLVLQLIAPGITVQAVPNDVPLTILQPAELITLSDFTASWAPEQHEVELTLPHDLQVDVTVDQNGQMAGYQIISGPQSVDLRHQLDQMLLFSRFRPMKSFGRSISGGHVILSFSAVRIRG